MASEARRVLIIDDEPDMRDFVQAALEEEGYQLLIATDGTAGLELARAKGADLIITDVQMPKKDGFALLYDLRQDPATKAIPVIFLTGVTEKTGIRFTADSVQEYMGERPEVFLDKPVDPDELRKTVRELLAKA